MIKHALLRIVSAILLATICAPVLSAAYTSIGAPSTVVRGTGTLNATLPAGWAAGNFCTAFVGSQGGASDTINAVTGWDELSARGTHTKILGRIMQGGDSGPTITFTGTFNHFVQVACWSGDVYTDLSTIVHVEADSFNSSASVPTVPGLTISLADTLVITAGWHSKTATSNGATYDALTGTTEIAEDRPSGTTVDFVWNFVQQTTASNFSGTRSMTGTTENGSVTSLSVSLKTAAVGAPTFTVAPNVTATTAVGYTVGFTPSASSTAYFGALAKGSAAPTCDQLEANTATGAQEYETKAVTGADSVTFGSLDFPTHDLYGCLESGTSDSAVASILDTFKAAPSGRLYDDLASIGAGSYCDGITSPSVAAGDVVEIDSATTSGSFAVTTFGTCHLSYSGDDSRQRLCFRIYDDSAAGWMSIASPSALCSGTRAALWFNNESPSFSPPTGSLVLDTGSAMTPMDVCAQASDPEDDTLTGAITAGALPTGLALGGTGNCTLSGTPTVEDEDGATVTFTATDIAGGTGDLVLTLYPIDTITTPDCQTAHLDLGSCLSQLEAVFLQGEIVGLEYSDTVAAGSVISQSPAPATEQEEDTVIELVVSRGKSGGSRLGISIRVR